LRTRRPDPNPNPNPDPNPNPNPNWKASEDEAAMMEKLEALEAKIESRYVVEFLFLVTLTL